MLVSKPSIRDARHTATANKQANRKILRVEPFINKTWKGDFVKQKYSYFCWDTLACVREEAKQRMPAVPHASHQWTHRHEEEVTGGGGRAVSRA